MLQKFLMAVPVTLLVVGGTTACASKKFVRTSVGEVNGKVDSLGRSVEETQERTRKNEGKISEVDQKAQAAAQSAQQANQAAAVEHLTCLLADVLLPAAQTRLAVQPVADVDEHGRRTQADHALNHLAVTGVDDRAVLHLECFDTDDRLRGDDGDSVFSARMKSSHVGQDLSRRRSARGRQKS